MHKNAWHWYFFGRFSKRWGPTCHGDGWLLSYTQRGLVTSPKIHEKLYELMHARISLSFQREKNLPKKIICLWKMGDRREGQLAFRASLGKSFLNFPNVFFLSKKLWKLLSIFAGWSGAVEVHLFLGEFFPGVCVSIELLCCVAWCQCGFITSSPLSFGIRADTSSANAPRTTVAQETLYIC